MNLNGMLLMCVFTSKCPHSHTSLSFKVLRAEHSIHPSRSALGVKSGEATCPVEILSVLWDSGRQKVHFILSICSFHR